MNDPIAELANNKEQVYLELKIAREMCSRKSTTEDELNTLVDSLVRIYLNTKDENLAIALLAQIETTQSVISYTFGLNKLLNGMRSKLCQNHNQPQITH